MNDAAGASLYVVMAVALVTWIGIFLYMWRLDTLARRLQRQLDDEPVSSQTHAPPHATLERRTPDTHSIER